MFRLPITKPNYPGVGNSYESTARTAAVPEAGLARRIGQILAGEPKLVLRGVFGVVWKQRLWLEK